MTKLARREAAREEQARRQRRQRTRWLSVAAVVLLLIAGTAGVAMRQASEPRDVVLPPSATSDGYGLAVGDGPVTVEIYLDFLCPACRQFDTATRPYLDRYLAEDAITLVYRPIAILDRASTTDYSTRSAAIAACAADAGGVDEYVAAMMARQPAQGSAGLSDDEIIALGTGQLGLPESTFGQCAEDGTYEPWVAASTDAATDRGVQGTPTVFVNGEHLETLSVEALLAMIDGAG